MTGHDVLQINSICGLEGLRALLFQRMYLGRRGGGGINSYRGFINVRCVVLMGDYSMRDLMV